LTFSIFYAIIKKAQRRFYMKKLFSFFISLLFLGGCCFSSLPVVIDWEKGVFEGNYCSSLEGNDGVVVINNSRFSITICQYGRMGLETLVKNFSPGGKFFIPVYRSGYYGSQILLSATAPNGVVATKKFYFSGYGYGTGSIIEECKFFDEDFKRR